MKSYIEHLENIIKTLKNEYITAYSNFIKESPPSEIIENFDGDTDDEEFKEALISGYDFRLNELNSIRKLIDEQKTELELAKESLEDNEGEFNEDHKLYFKIKTEITKGINKIFKESLGMCEIVIILSKYSNIKTEYFKYKLNNFISQYHTIKPKKYVGNDIFVVELPNSFIMSYDDNEEDDIPTGTISVNTEVYKEPKIIKIEL